MPVDIDRLLCTFLVIISFSLPIFLLPPVPRHPRRFRSVIIAMRGSVEFAVLIDVNSLVEDDLPLHCLSRCGS